MNKTEINVEFEGDICALDFAWSLEIVKTKNIRDTAYALSPIFRGAKLIKKTETGGVAERSSTPSNIALNLIGQLHIACVMPRFYSFYE